MNSLRPRLVLALVLAVSLVRLAACRSSVDRAEPRRAIDAGAFALYERGVEERRRGDLDAALESFRRAVALADDFVEAHREIQNALLVLCRPGDLLVDYGERVERAPDDPAFHYLYGRLLASPEAQKRRFRRAVELRDDFAWGHYGLAYHDELEGRLDSALAGYDRAIALSPGEALFVTRRAETLRLLHRLEESESAFRQSIALDPASPDSRFGLALVLQLSERMDDAIAVCEEAIESLPDPSPMLLLYRELLADAGSSAAVRRAVEVLTRAGARRPQSEAIVRSTGFLRRDLGEDDLAVRLLETSLELGGDPSTIVPVLRPLHVKAGRYVRANEVTALAIPPHFADEPLNLVQERHRAAALWASAAEKAPGDCDVLLCLARAYEDTGFLEEAGFVYARAQLLAPARAGEIEPARRGAETARLAIERVKERFREIYRRHLETGESPDLETVIVEIGAILDEAQGSSSPPGAELARVRSFPFLGAVTEMTAGQDAPRIPAFFARYNHYLLIGRRAGGPVEGYLTRMVAWMPDRTATIWGRAVPHELVVGDGVELPSYREYLGDGIGGFALDRTAVVNVSAVLAWSRLARRAHSRWAPDPDALFSDAIPSVASPEERASLDFPLCVGPKLEFLAMRDLPGGGRPSAGTAEDLRPFFEAIERHEVAHLFDAQRYLPVLSNPLRSISLLVGSGFSASRVEAKLEGNAELAALVHAPSPRLVLSQMAASTEGSGGSSPHMAGYAEVVRQMVTIIEDEIERFPEIDRARAILPQLFRLGDERLRDLGRRVARDRGLLVDS